MKKMLIAGNWKMNLNSSDAKSLINEISKAIKFMGDLKLEVLVCPPYTSIPAVISESNKSEISVGAQNCHFENSGAFTGEVSVDMIKDLGCSFVITGHSERRTIFCENDQTINKKASAVLSNGLSPIICIGETLEERNSGRTFEVLDRQLEIGLKDLNQLCAEKIVIAYEPVWAIGTGVSATIEQVDEAHNWIRNYLTELMGGTGKVTAILYGGSLNPNNAMDILSLDNVNGGLIGGASLKCDSFVSIIESANKIQDR